MARFWIGEQILYFAIVDVVELKTYPSVKEKLRLSIGESPLGCGGLAIF